MEAKGWTAVRIFRLAVLGILAVALLTGGTLRLRDALANEDVAAPDFNLLTEEELAGTPYVSGNVELVLDCFAESYTTRNDVRVSDESDELYYLVPAAPTDSEGYYHCTYLLCLEVRPEHFAVMDQIMDETWDENFTGDEYTRFEIGTSRVTSMESDLLALREEYAEEVGLVDWLAESELLGSTDEAEIRARILPYVVRVGVGPESPLVGVALFAAGLLVLGVFLYQLLHRRQQANPYGQNDGGPAAHYDGSTPDGGVSPYGVAAQNDAAPFHDAAAQNDAAPFHDAAAQDEPLPPRGEGE